MDLDSILLKEISELSDEEKNFVRTHKEELEESEKETYKDIITEKEKEEDKGFSFKSQEELDNYLDRFVESKLPKKEEKKPEGEEIPDFFPEDYKPKNWNEFAKTYTPKLADFFAKNPKIKEAVKEEITLSKEEEEEERKKLSERIDTEMEDLRKAHKDIPVIGTEEGVKWEKDLAQVFIDFPSLRTLDEAYRIMQRGKETKEKEEEEKENLAKRVGGGSGTGGESKPRKYSEIARRSMDEAFERAREKLEASE